MGNKEEIFKKHFELVSGKKADDMVVSHMKYVQDAMQEYSDQQNKQLLDKVKEKDSEILALKQSNDRYNQDYSECQSLLKEQLAKTVKHKARVDELEKIPSKIIEIINDSKLDKDSVCKIILSYLKPKTN